MRRDALPLTYDECRARFRHTAATAGLTVTGRALAARGPVGQELTIDIAQFGSADPTRALIVMSGVHGVEGFIGSAMQCELLEQLACGSATGRATNDLAIVIVHAVNPWGMAWWRRQNESNVDLNRNWGRDGADSAANPGYAELHPMLCPAADEPPDDGAFLEVAGTFVERHGLPWVREAISAGQYTHPDGLYFGGDRTEASTIILADEIRRRLSSARLTLSVDLHTGHGAYAAATILSDELPDSPGDRWLRERFGYHTIENTVGNPQATSATKRGQLGHGLAEVLAASEHHSVTLEIGTCDEVAMLLAERAEHWVHGHGDRSDPDHASIVWDHRTASTPDDPIWEQRALEAGRAVLAAAIAAIGG